MHIQFAKLLAPTNCSAYQRYGHLTRTTTLMLLLAMHNLRNEMHLVSLTLIRQHSTNAVGFAAVMHNPARRIY